MYYLKHSTCGFMVALFLFSATSLKAQEFNTYKAPVYTKSWSAPSSYPDRISLTFSDDPTSSFSVTWRTDTTITKAVAEIAVATAAPRFWRNSKSYDANTETMNAMHIANAKVIANYHSVSFSDLEPNTLYAYRVGDGEKWSEWIHYRTASKEADPFTFLYVGDAQNQVMELWSRLIREGYRKQPDARFIIHAGDLVNRAHKDSEWHEWFEAGGWIHSMLPAIPVPGNHEYNEFNSDEEEEHLSYQWQYQFTLPENGPEGIETLNETTYYVDYQGLRIVALNSNVHPEEQAEWLDQVLTENPNKWTILTFHHPIFSASRGRDNEIVRQTIKPIIDKHNVDLVLNGHDHSYARGNTPAEAENISSGMNYRDQTGTVYVVSVSGGKMYTLKPEGWDNYESERKVAAENTQLFQEISLDKDTLHFRSYTATRDLYDAFKLVKEDGLPNRIIEIRENRIPERTHDNTIAYEHPAVGNFEEEDLGIWNLSLINDAMEIDHKTARKGDHSAKFNITEGNPSSYITDPYDAKIGQTTWYGFSTFIPEDLNLNQKLALAKWTGVPDNDFEESRPPALELIMKNGKIDLTAHSDTEFYSTQGSVQQLQPQIEPGSFKKGAWNDVVVKSKVVIQC
ncbi:MAG: metallophosphoesterase [Gracilimonas sp.]|nr:metallophosphoesterase [Gracilimonas sp.]